MMIRAATRDDLDEIQAIARAAYGLYVDRMGREPAPMVADFASQIDDGLVQVVADEDGEVAGYAVAYPRGDHLHLENVAVDPARQGQGLGKLLIEHVEETARGAGFDAVELYTNIHMTENQRLYPALGYVETGRRTEDGFERVFYRKEI